MSEAEIAKKIRTSSLGKKLGVLIKKKGVPSHRNARSRLKMTLMNDYFRLSLTYFVERRIIKQRLKRISQQVKRFVQRSILGRSSLGFGART